VVEWLLAVAALLFLGTTVAVVWSLVVLVRRMTRRARWAVEPARVRVLAVQGVLSPTAAVRCALARDVLLARQAYQLARRDKRPVVELAPTLRGLEQVARSLDVDLRMGRAVTDEVGRTREAARSLRLACGPVPARRGLLDEVVEAAERARLVAEAHRELS
jgi:hypothetical protein